jgi:HmuY protein
VWVILAGTVFLLFVLTVVITSVTRPRPEGRPPTVLTAGPEPDGLITDRTLTVDARNADTWVRLDLSTGGEVPASDPDAWDLAVRRFQIVVNGGPGFRGRAGVVLVRGVPFDSVVEAPADGYAVSRVTTGGDSTAIAFEDWYDYSFFSHLLTPADVVYVLRTADGRYAKFELLDYYCPGADPGCLTFRYAYQGDGSRRLVP